jgi:hypothetical protein
MLHRGSQRTGGGGIVGAVENDQRVVRDDLETPGHHCRLKPSFDGVVGDLDTCMLKGPARPEGSRCVDRLKGSGDMQLYVKRPLAII